jgi:sugar phosphate isomerase/epimerase
VDVNLSALLTSLPLPLPAALGALADLGFAAVDVVPGGWDAADREALADSGLIVCCAAVGRDLPEGCTLDMADLAGRRCGVQVVERQLIEAAQLGARFAYLVPGPDPQGLLRFADSCAQLAAFAERRMMRLCVENMPGRVLPSAAAVLDWLAQPGLEPVGLLLDVGHCLISSEDPARLVGQAGDRLGYVHLDDNDGRSDLHWPLLTGRLTAMHLRDLFAALRATDFSGGVALELNPSLPDPVRNLSASREIVRAHLVGG